MPVNMETKAFHELRFRIRKLWNSVCDLGNEEVEATTASKSRIYEQATTACVHDRESKLRARCRGNETVNFDSESQDLLKTYDVEMITGPWENNILDTVIRNECATLKRR